MSEFINSKWAEFNPTELIPKHLVNRYDDKKKSRFYYFKDEQGEYQSAAGITSWLSNVMPESSFLTDWKIKWGADWKTLLNLTAEYGTIMHACFGHMMQFNSHPDQHYIDSAKDILKELRRFDSACSDNMIEKNIISFQKFREDYNLKPLLIEAMLICLASTGAYYALTLDLLAEIEYERKEKTEVQDGFYVKGDKKGQPKFVTETTGVPVKEIISLDFKSNPFNKDKKTFFDAHKFQLLGTSRAVWQNFGIKVDKVYNWSPNNWKTNTGDYTMHEWKLTPQDFELMDCYEKLASLSGAFKPSGSIQVFAKWAPGVKAEEMIKNYPYLDFVKMRDELKP